MLIPVQFMPTYLFIEYIDDLSCCMHSEIPSVHLHMRSAGVGVWFSVESYCTETL